MNNAKLFTKLTCLLLISGFAFASDDPEPLLPAEMSDDSGEIDISGGDVKDNPSAHSSFTVVDGDDDDDNHISMPGQRRSGGSGTSSSGSSGDLSDDSDDFMIHTTKKWWQYLQEKVVKYPYTTALGVSTLALGGLYKFHKPFRTKVNSMRDKIKKNLREFWQKQQQEPLTVGFVAKTGLALSAVYCAGKARVLPTLATPFIRTGNYIASLNLSQKCVLGVGVATTALAVSWAYNKFAKKQEVDTKPVPAVNK